MSKNRPFIPPPVFSPPNVRPAPASVEPMPVAERGEDFVAEVVAPTPPPALAIVAPPARVGSVKVLADRIEYTNPTIDLTEHMFLNGKGAAQTRKLEPSKAVVAHGLIVIEEMGLSIPIERALIRTF